MPAISWDLLYLEPGATGGMETYARELLPRVRMLMPDARCSVLCGRELAAEWRDAPWMESCEVVEAPVSSASRAWRTAIEYTWGAARTRVDLVHGLGNTVPISPGARRVVTIHDCIHFRYPETTSPVLSAGMRALTRVNVRLADRIIAVSQATADDLRALLGAAPGKIDVVPSGPGGARSREAVCEGDIVRVRERIGVPRAPIVLSVSARRPHKNLATLIRAIADVPDAVLVLPGYPTAYDGALRGAADSAGVGDRVVLTGWLSEADLDALYAAATCVVLPTLAEGFGLPVLESAQRGVPVAASDIPVLREVGGEAVRYFDPQSAADIARVVQALLADPDERERLIAAGRRRVERFSWDAAAAGTIDAYLRVLSSGS